MLRGSLGDVQRVVTAVDTWSQTQLMQLNADKCKELIIDFKENPHNFSPLVVDSKALPVIDCAKILGVTISSDLKWNNQVVDCIKKANKRIHFIVLLKRARVPCNDIVNFYCTTIRSVLEYCAPLFHHALPAYLSEDMEKIQKRVLPIILPDMSYQDCLDSLGLPTLKERRNELCKRLFDSIANNSGHKLNYTTYCLQEMNKATACDNREHIIYHARAQTALDSPLCMQCQKMTSNKQRVVYS